MSRLAGVVPDCVVTLRPGSPAPRLYCIHAVTGSVRIYQAFADAAAITGSIIGFQAFWARGDRPAPTSLEEMATYYIKELRRQQGTGPYHLYGWSSGGLLALEMAHQLEAAGDRLGVIALGDTQPPLAVVGRSAPRESIERYWWSLYVRIAVGAEPVGLAAPEHPFWKLDRPGRLRLILNYAREARSRLFLAHLAVHPIDAHFAMFWGLCEAIARHRPRPIRAGVVYFQAVDEPDRGAIDAWNRLAGGGCVVINVPGDHVSIMEPPAVVMIARAIAERVSAS